MFKRTAGRLLDVARDVGGACLIVASEGLEDLGCIVRGLPESPQPLSQPRAVLPMPEPSDCCEDCGTVHDALVPFGLPPELALLAAIRAEQGAPSPVEAQPAAGPAWSPAFAEAVQRGDLVSLDGLGGRETAARVFAVRGVRRHAEGELGHGSGAAVTLLLEDVASGAVISPMLSVLQGLRVAPGVPDSVPSDFGGAA
jgi:hypothetical protein